MCYELEIHPRDVLYFRDGRPIGSSAEGSGAMWPFPLLFHSALLSTLHGRLGDEIEQWESSHKHPTQKEQSRKERGRGLKVRYNFGGLKTWGTFPKKGGNIYVPTPADLLANDDNGSGGMIAPMRSPENATANLPKPLKYPVGSFSKPSKEKPGGWIALKELARYLEGATKKLETVSAEQLYLTESRPGIGIDPESGVTEDGKFYSAEYLRLTQGTSMTAFAECIAKKYNGAETDVLKEFFNSADQTAFLYGGQRGVAYLKCNREKTSLPSSVTTKATQLKWVLLSPACFSAGWLPGWIDSTNGNVLLKENKKTSVKAQLVAARIAKPIAVSGWNLASQQPKATRLLVPAGSVYYFECESTEDAQRLCRILHGSTKSDMLGEQGFGFGVCGTWNFNHFDQN